MKRLLSLITAAVLTSVIPAYAQRAPDSETLRRLCNAIERRAVDLDASSMFTYEYEPILWELAGASDTDDVETARAKIRQLWSTQHSLLVCTTNGKAEPILRFAIRQDFMEFIEDLSEKYRIDTTLPDATDGKTLLGFMHDELTHTKSSRVPSVAYRRLVAFYGYMKLTVPWQRSAATFLKYSRP